MWVFSVKCVSPTTLGHFRKNKKIWKRQKTTGHQAAISIGRFSLFGKWNRAGKKGYKIEGLVLTSHSCLKNIKE